MIQKSPHHKIGTALSVFAVALLFLAQVAPLWASPSSGNEITVCSAFGTRTIIVDENGNEREEEPTQYTKNHCPLCLVSNAHILTPTSQNAERVNITLHRITYSDYTDSISVQRSYNPQNIRAPPHIS